MSLLFLLMSDFLSPLITSLSKLFSLHFISFRIRRLYANTRFIIKTARTYFDKTRPGKPNLFAKLIALVISLVLKIALLPK